MRTCYRARPGGRVVAGTARLVAVTDRIARGTTPCPGRLTRFREMRVSSLFSRCCLVAAAMCLASPSRAQTSSEPAAVTVSDSAARARTSRELRTRFVRDQTILGFTVYGPSFAAMVADDGVTGGAAYLVMAGGSFFASAELSRRMQVTEARQLLSSAMAWRTAGTALAFSASGEAGRRQDGAWTLLGGLTGTGVGLALGKGLTGGEAAAAVFGHDFAAMSALAAVWIIDGELFVSNSGLSSRSTVALAATAGAFGYAAGRTYAGRAKHNVTVGDVQTMWVGASIGLLGASAAIANSGANDETVAGTLLVGSALGVLASERWLVRRYDQTRYGGNLLALGGTAGGLMGIGIGILVAGEADRGESLTLGFATAGAIGGVASTVRYLQPQRDRGRLAFLERVQFTPMNAVAAASKRPGNYPLLRFTF